MSFKAGQRWFSQTEPELGLGLIEAVEKHRIAVSFPATGDSRVYAQDRSPLQRHLVKPGQPLYTTDGDELIVEAVEEREGILYYQVSGPDGTPEMLPEMLLAPELRLDSADRRLLSGQVNQLSWYLLRRRLREQYAHYQQQPARGLLGGRLHLNPHQYHVAAQATRAGLPRAMLSDEVGLGKTIEAGLILWHCQASGLAERLLVTVPDHLLHQWLVEMIRKFDLPLSIFDDSRLEAALMEDPDNNPFASAQWVLVPHSLWTRPAAAALALEAGWDCLVVDEAHHLHPDPEDPEAAAASQAVWQLAEQTPGVLLLTATPEQDGARAHFERLHLLDPQRFTDYESFQATTDQLVQLSSDLRPFMTLEDGNRPDTEVLRDWCRDPESERLLAAVSAAATDTAYESALEALVSHLIDTRGIGRLQFRNSRERIRGFPERELSVHTLEAPADYPLHHPWPERAQPDQVRTDPRTLWLLNWLQSADNAAEKALVICHDLETAEALELHLRLSGGIACALFHEDMDLVERDRAAAWFAEPDTGAQVLVCSEIGSEGRNFQFAHHLICFDLPPHPDLLEQRIGRLDRLGQTEVVQIHVPVLAGSRQQQWLRWYHEGLNAFTHTCDIGGEVLATLISEQTIDLGQDRPLPHAEPTSVDLTLVEWPQGAAFEALLATTAERAAAARQRAREGRHRLLEWQSFRRQAAEDLVEQIAHFETSHSPESIVLELLELLGIECEDAGHGLFEVRPGERVIPDSLPEMLDSGCLLTFRRSVAVARDDVRFITWEHPLIRFLLDTLDQTGLGSAGVTLIRVPSLPPGSLYLEATWRPLMQHRAALVASQFLPESLFRCVVDQRSQDVSRAFAAIDLRDLEQRLDKPTLLAIIRQQEDRVEALVEAARTLARPQLDQLRTEAREQAMQHFTHELGRLDTLSAQTGQADRHARNQLTTRQAAVLEAIDQAELHLDSLRLIVSS